MKALFKKLFSSPDSSAFTPNKNLDLTTFIRSKMASISAIQKNHLVFIVVVAGFVISVLILIFIHNQEDESNRFSVAETKRSGMILNELTDMQTQLQKMSQGNANATELKNTLATFSQELGDIQKSLNEAAKDADIKKMSEQLAAVKDELAQTMTSGANGKQYIDAKTLPFSVTAIDLIDQQAFISVNYNNHIIPLSIGDALAGWKVADADYESQAVEFGSTQGQFVKVSLQEQ